MSGLRPAKKKGISNYNTALNNLQYFLSRTFCFFIISFRSTARIIMESCKIKDK